MKIIKSQVVKGKIQSTEKIIVEDFLAELDPDLLKDFEEHITRAAKGDLGFFHISKNLVHYNHHVGANLEEFVNAQGLPVTIKRVEEIIGENRTCKTCRANPVVVMHLLRTLDTSRPFPYRLTHFLSYASYTLTYFPTYLPKELKDRMWQKETKETPRIVYMGIPKDMLEKGYILVKIRVSGYTFALVPTGTVYYLANNLIIMIPPEADIYRQLWTLFPETSRLGNYLSVTTPVNYKEEIIYKNLKRLLGVIYIHVLSDNASNERKFGEIILRGENLDYFTGSTHIVTTEEETLIGVSAKYYFYIPFNLFTSGSEFPSARDIPIYRIQPHKDLYNADDILAFLHDEGHIKTLGSAL